MSTVLERVWQRGDIYKADYEGYYCVDCEEYKDEADMDAGAAWRRRGVCRQPWGRWGGPRWQGAAAWGWRVICERMPAGWWQDLQSGGR